MSAMAVAGAGTGSSGGWGDWRLGDLADTVAKAAAVLGGSRRVTSVTVVAPSEGEHTPRVDVRVESLELAEGAIAWITDGVCVTRVEESPSQGSWSVEADGIALRILFDYVGDES